MEAILNVLPESRQQETRQFLVEMSGRSAAELGKQLETLRHGDRDEAIRRCGTAGQGQLPVPLERWLYARAWESDGREDY